MVFKSLAREWKFIITVSLVVLCVGIFLRFYNLTHLPVFGDEAIYIRWAQIMRNEPTLRFLPLSDGKQPLFMWVAMPFLKFFSDPLFAARLVSVFTGIQTAAGVFVLSYILFRSKPAALASLAVYCLAPFGFFFDRLALADSMLSSFGIWAVIFAVQLVKKLRLDLAMILGGVMALALLTKSPALFFSLLIPTTWVFVQLPKTRKAAINRVFNMLLLFGTAYFLAYGFYNFILRLGPNFHMIAARNLDYVFPISHLWQNPKDPFIFHFHRSLEWYVIYGSWWLVGLFVLGLTNFKKFPRQVFVVLSFFITPLLVQSMFAKVFTTRYVFFTFPFYAIIVGSAFYSLDVKNTLSKFKVLLGILFVAQSVYFFIQFQTNLAKTPLARTDRSGFLEEWTSGTGIKESAQIVISEHLKDSSKKIVVGTEGYFGTLPDGFQMYTANYPITVIGVGLDLHDIPQSLLDSANAGNKTYLVINSSRLKMEVADPGLKVVASFKKADRPTFVHEYNLHGLYDTLYLLEINQSD